MEMQGKHKDTNRIENIPTFSYVTCNSQLHINMMVQCPEICGIEKRNVAQNNEL